MTLSKENQIIKLNSETKATLGRSDIHGIGVIAIVDIYKGEQVYADRMPTVYNIPYGSLGKLFPEVRKMVLERWPSIVNGSKFIYPDARLLSIMNHSDDPNYDPNTDKALRDIKVVEEITEDYRTMKNYQQVFPWLK